jgi:hypothetical protein
MNNPADEISQAEKRRILANDRKVMSSYLAHAQANVDDDRGGRFAAVGKAATVTGTSPGPIYPRLPPTSPWHSNPMPPEPFIDGTGEGNRLGYSVDDMNEASAAPGGQPGLDTADAATAAVPTEGQMVAAAVKPWRRF